MSLAEIRIRHPLAYVAAACTVAVACLGMVPAETLEGMVAQTAVAAAGVTAFVALADRRALSCPPLPHPSRAVRLACAYLLAIALAAGMAEAALALAVDGTAPLAPAVPLARRIALFLALCLLTGLFEETLFRGVMFRGFFASLREAGWKRPALAAAAVSAAVFGVLHVTGAPASVPLDGIACAQCALKPLQAALFGFIMAGLYAKTGNLWLTAALHAGFNALLEGPAFAVLGAPPTTYVTGSLVDLALLAATSALFIPAAVRAGRFL